MTEQMLRHIYYTWNSTCDCGLINASSFTSEEFSKFCTLNGIEDVQCLMPPASLNEH